MEKVKKKSGAFSFFMRCIVPLFLTCYWIIAHGVAEGVFFHLFFVYWIMFFITQNRGWKNFRGFLHIITFIGFICAVILSFQGVLAWIFCFLCYCVYMLIIYLIAHYNFLGGASVCGCCSCRRSRLLKYGGSS